MEFPRQQYLSGLPFPFQVIFQTQGSNTHSYVSCIAGRFFTCWAIREASNFLDSLNTPTLDNLKLPRWCHIQYENMGIQSALQSSAKGPTHAWTSCEGAKWLRGKVLHGMVDLLGRWSKFFSQWHLSTDAHEEKISHEVGSWGWVREKKSVQGPKAGNIFSISGTERPVWEER